MVDGKGEIKVKYANGGRRAQNEIRDYYMFILLVRASHFKSVSKTISIPDDLGCQCDWRTYRSRRGNIDASRKFRRKIFGCVGVLIGWHSSLV
jgi:hypothetical protein